MPEIESCTIEFDTLAPSEQATIIAGPSVAVIGWIPFYRDLAEMPASEYKTHPLVERRILNKPVVGPAFVPAAMSVLFAGGNPSDPLLENNPSPASFSDHAQFLKLLSSKNYRAVLMIDEVKAVFGQDGRPIRLSFKRIDDAVGFTPIRIQSESLMITYYDKGRGSSDVTPDIGQQAAILNDFVRFKIGALGDFGCFLLTGKRAPSALMRIQYRVEGDGRITIDFYGSHIPSQSMYVNWSRVALHDMMSNSRDCIDEFLGAGRCKDAPLKHHEIWTGAAPGKDFRAGDA